MADAQAYRKLTHREHVLTSPGMYIGSIVKEPCNAWVMTGLEDDAASEAASEAPSEDGKSNNKSNSNKEGSSKERMAYKDGMEYCPGLLKVVDEILVNAVDHSVRTRRTEGMVPVKRIDVTISPDRTWIEVANDGDSVPVERHAEHDGVWVPELIFGHMLTSANYDQSVDRVVGGQNGIGAKACNIFSAWFEVDVADTVRGLRYVQRFQDNMTTAMPPKVTKARGSKPRTVIRFCPDYARFGYPDGRLSDDMHALIVKRVYDMTAVTDPSVAVWLNGRRLAIKSFDKYVDLYALPSGKVYERISDGWEVAVALNGSQGTGLQQVSFVNGVATLRGGKHVDHIVTQLTRRVCDLVATRQKSAAASLKPQFLRDALMVFVRATIPSPTFDSQSKETLTTVPSKFGAKVELSDAFIEKAYKLPGLVDHLVAMSGFVASKDAARKTDGSKRSTVNVPKLDDAEWAGTAKSDECTLILTEGDSAKASAVAGLSVVGRQRYGVFPLRGKVMNVCDMGVDKIAANAEISAIKKILGLQNGREYTSTHELRYGRVMLMTDADLDGSHIKGLVMNLFAQLWPSLLRLEGFIVSLLTPIIKAWPPGGAKEFYTVGEFEAWASGLEEGARKRLRSKYYKGLGTSTADEARDWFKRMRIMAYAWEEPGCREAFSKAFHKKRADDRKAWLQAYDATNTLVQHGGGGGKGVSYADFVDRDLVHFSNYDVLRSIPSVIDGFKVSQRKAMYGCRKRGSSRDEVRVAQLAAYVSEHSCFHHGEASMQGTLIGMAQTFVGSGNNVPLLEAIGQFGTRLNGGSDAASPRYIHTRLSQAALKLFPKEDDAILEWLDDDGISVEPRYYLPVLPLALLNGSSGIGTGYSTTVPSYDPREVIAAVKLWIESDPEQRATVGIDPKDQMLQKPWHRGYVGEIEVREGNKLRSRGVVAAAGATKVRVSELPLGVWTEDFKEALAELVEKTSDIKAFTNESTESTVDFTITFASAAAAKTWLAPADNSQGMSGMSALEAALKMSSTKGLGTGNMHLFSAGGQIQRFETPWDILRAYAPVRLDGYVKRRAHLLQRLRAESAVLFNRVRFIELVVDETIALGRKTDEEVEAMLAAQGLEKEGGGTYDYLLDMPMSSMTLERKAQLDAQLSAKLAEIARIEGTTAEGMWLEDIEALEKVLTAP
jgi:DNA topoisomerase-2